MTAPPVEVELKLAFDDAVLSALEAAAALRNGARGRATTKSVRSVYWDTAGLDLYRAGMVLRLRDASPDRIQTVKLKGLVRAGLMERTEVECAVPGAEPDLAAISDPGLREAIEREGTAPGRTLGPVVETEVRRTTRILERNGSVIELALDVGDVRVRTGARPIRELELELVSGEAAHLYDLALDIAAEVPLRPVSVSKAELGFAALEGTTPQPSKARPIRVPRGALLDAVLSASFGECLRQIDQNLAPAALGSDPEGVHQMRVGVRRFRAALSLFKGVLPDERLAALRSELKWLGAELGICRDLDVFQTELLEPLIEHRPDDGALKHLRDEVQLSRAAAQEQLRVVLASGRTTRLLLTLGRWVVAREWRDQPLSERSARIYASAASEAQRLLSKRHRRVARKGRRPTERSMAELHELRIELKKLRYASEFLGGAFPEASPETFTKRVAALQDVLGALNDAATAARLLEPLTREDAPVERVHALGFVAGWANRGAEDHLARLGPRWKRFRKTGRFWT